MTDYDELFEQTEVGPRQAFEEVQVPDGDSEQQQEQAVEHDLRRRESASTIDEFREAVRHQSVAIGRDDP